MIRLLVLALATLPAAAHSASPACGDIPATGRPVVSETVSSDPTRKRAFAGVVAATHSTDLAFQTIGRVARIEVDPGDRVAGGDVLATLDRVSLQEDVASARAALSAALAEAAFARQSFERVNTLAERGIAPRAQLEEAEATRDATQAQAEAAQADLARARDALGHGTLVAPNDGIVLSTEVEEGTVVAAGTPILTLADLKGREAVIDVPTEFLQVLPRDAQFEVVVHAEFANPRKARLRLVEPVIGDNIRTRRLRLTITEGDSDFRIGSLVSATLAQLDLPVMTLPATALTGSETDPAVWRVLPPDRRVERVAVRIGRQLADRIEITEGLSVGDEIVIRGAACLRDGLAVGPRVAP
ncbi:efflux RND transporter periplasmic adaptor subunit [Rhodovulum visakhapatnamense]|uniref:Multidrug efflux system membrane fusion protein n=1 Tax=Rhodovulum visakhapatnamense TaxID=364297 RepID=A0A4R8FSR5_9RHOB|nr:efflux RND transporter periplasmic adaptor subunit [Rhodovulum visakhapatnamense]TDX29671.1 multidrug efflux system membrane fusion protein [Rhodovulum visakhapatnamense]